MYHTKKMKSCSNYKALENDLISKYQNNSLNVNCKSCAYFSSRNCGMDVADSIEPSMDLFC